jgi:bifunctional non-homologous end joining protein LigD
MGVLEIHPWGSSEHNLEKPDNLTFDLDPGPGTDWKDIVQGAAIMKDYLDALGLQ